MDNEIKSALTEELDNLCNNEPSPVAIEIGEYEKAHSYKVLTDYHRFAKQFEDFFDLLSLLIYNTNFINKEDWQNSKPAQFFITANSLEFLYSSYDLLVKGHYANSITLIRTAYESLIRVIYLSCYPNEKYAVFYKKNDGTREFNLSGFLKNDLKLDWERFYSLMSSIAHSNGYMILTEAKKINKEGQTEPICLKFEFNEKLLAIGINYLDFLLWVFLKISLFLFVKADNKFFPPELLEKSHKVEKALEGIFAAHPNSPWIDARNDVNYIFNIIHEAESGKDWKRLVRK